MTAPAPGSAEPLIPTLVDSRHSHRSGIADHFGGGVPRRTIMRQTGQRPVEMMRHYILAASLFLENAAAQVDL